MTERVALFVTCLADTLFPEVGRATVTVLERLGIEVVLPAEQTCCGQMHANSGYPGEAELLARRFVEIFDGLRGDRDAVRLLRGAGARALPGLARRRRPRRAGADVGAVAVPHRACSGSTRSARAYAGTVAYHPTCHSLRLLRVGDAPLRLLRAVPGLELVELPDAEECCGFGGTFAVKNADVSAAMLDEKLAAIVASRRRRRVRVRQLLPDAHRRRPPPSRLARAAGAPRGDPRLVSSAARDARPESFPHAAPAALANAPGARQHPPRDGDDPRQAGGRRRRGARLGGAARRRRRRSRTTRSPASTRCSSSSRRRSQAAGGVVHWARDAAEANEIVTALVRAEGADEVVKVKSLATDEIQLNEALEAAGIRADRDRPGRADRPARGRAAVASARARDPQEPRRDPRPLPRAARPAGALGRSGRARGGGAAAPARGVPPGAGRDLGRELRRRRHRHDLRRRVRGQRPHVHDAARGADHGDGDREGDPALPRPRGVPAAPAALVDRRADEPVHVALDRRARGRRAEAVPPRPARRRAHARARRPGRPAGAALHPLLGLHQRLPRLPPDRRARLPLAVRRADRRDPRAAARGRERGGRRRCRSPRRSAAPVTTSARC